MRSNAVALVDVRIRQLTNDFISDKNFCNGFNYRGYIKLVSKIVATNINNVASQCNLDEARKAKLSRLANTYLSNIDKDVRKKIYNVKRFSIENNCSIDMAHRILLKNLLLKNFYKINGELFGDVLTKFIY
jgi:hypothetical protein